MNQPFEEVKKKLGFGCMRLPMSGEQIDHEETKKMVDEFIEQGFNYFDTAHGYHGGMSEIALKECLTKRYDRDRYVLTDKLSSNYFEKEEDIPRVFEEQLEACGVDYFDFYLMHSLTKENYDKYVNCNAFEVAQELKKQGKIRHVGISFHDQASFLDRILTEHPEVEAVQLQFNYADYDNEGVQSRKCYEVCEKYHKPVIVMEPVKGGSLVKLPEKAKKIFDDLQGGSYASYAIRFSASFPKVFMVLSGMSNLEMMRDNTSYMIDFVRLSQMEFDAVAKVSHILSGQDSIACTACRYCLDVCVKQIPIPDIFSCLNAKTVFDDWNSDFYYGVVTRKGGKASDCIKCGKCEHICPQHLPIREKLVDAVAVFEKKQEQ